MKKSSKLTRRTLSVVVFLLGCCVVLLTFFYPKMVNMVWIVCFIFTAMALFLITKTERGKRDQSRIVASIAGIIMMFLMGTNSFTTWWNEKQDD